MSTDRAEEVDGDAGGRTCDDPAAASFIASLTSADAQRFIEEHGEDDPAALALRYRGKVSFELPAAVEQIRLLRRAREKLPTLRRAGCLLTRKAFEQASAEAVASWKAARYRGGTFLDGTAGLGVDAWAIGRSFEDATLVESDPFAATVLRHNLERLGWRPDAIECLDIADFLRSTRRRFDLVYLDPDRRPDAAGRVSTITDSRPDVTALAEDLVRCARRVLVKLSPLVDPVAIPRELSSVVAITVVSLENEVKEVLVEQAPGTSDIAAPTLLAVDISRRGTREVEGVLGDESRVSVETGVEGDWFLEPGHAVIRAGLVAPYARRLGLRSVNRRAAYLVANEPPPDDFLGRVFRIRAMLPYRTDALRSELRALGIGRASVARRAFPWTTAQIRAQLRIRDGDDAALFFVESDERGHVCFVCERAAPG